MTVDELKKELDKLSFKSINFGHNVLKLAQTQDFDAWQNGARTDKNGNSLISGKEGGWKDQWFVIAKDSLDDPHFVDLNDERVYTAIEESGDWFPVPVSDNFAHYIKILKALKELSSGRETSEKFEDNPLKNEQIDYLIETIHSKTDVDEEYHYWEYWLDE